MAPEKVAKFDELEDGVARCVTAGGTKVAIVRVGDTVYAVADLCTHAEASLSEGEVYEDDLEIECPLHGSTFSLIDGEPQALPATEPVAVYKATVNDGEVCVDVV